MCAFDRINNLCSIIQTFLSFRQADKHRRRCSRSAGHSTRRQPAGRRRALIQRSLSLRTKPMEAALVSASTGMMEPLISKLTKLLGDEYVKLKGIRKQVRFLRDELSAMSAALQMLGDAQELNPVMKDWRDKLRELAYDIEDCIDDFMARVDLDKDAVNGFNFKGLFLKFKKLIEFHEIANEIEQLKARAIEASERHKRYDFTEHSSTNSSTSAIAIDPRLPALYEEIGNLVGIESPKERIIEWLTTTVLTNNGSSSARLKVISIAGCGGLGKTTLANQVYHAVRSQFMCGVFVTVSRSPNMRKVLRDIAQGVGIPEKTSKNDDEQQLIEKLREHLQDKRYFAVIDDIWDANAWGIIKLALLDNNCGSRIIATTRSFTVASCCSSQGGYVYNMEPLGFDDSKRLFVKRAFGSEDCSYPHLEDVLNEILGKCSGLPLAIITIASMLTDQQARSEWDRVANAIGSALAKNPDAEKMMNIISLSYVDVPHHVRTCLLYLSVFPEDYQITKKSLINKWIAEGFIHEEQGMSTYKIGERYFNDLINRSLIQPIDVKFGQAKACRVHDIILDYLKCKAAEENFVISLDAGENNGYTSECKVRRLCVVYKPGREIVTLSTSLILSHVRSLTIFGYSNEASLLPFSNGTSLLPFTALRVLDIYDRIIQHHHLLHIEKLFHLKYLRLGLLDSPLPDKVGDLQYLETLDVRRCKLRCLPSTIGKLQRLTRLYVHWATTFPNGMIGQMCSLEELSKYGVLSYEQGKDLQEFSKLTKLKNLKIRWRFGLPPDIERRNQVEDYHSYVGSLLSSCNLHSLYLINKSVRSHPLLLDSWHPTASCSLQRFHLKGCDTFKVPNWMGSLENLGVLEMSILCITPQDIKILGAIPSLHSLKLRTVGGTSGKIFIHGSDRFRSLKYFSLDIGLCGTALEFEAGSMPKLEQLQLWFCLHKMECVNYASDFGIQHLSALSMVKVSIGGDCSRDTKYNPAEDEDDSTIRCVAGAIKAATDILPNRPILRFDIWHDNDCESFKSGLKQHNQDTGGALTEWLKVWQIEEDQHTPQVTP